MNTAQTSEEISRYVENPELLDRKIINFEFRNNLPILIYIVSKFME